MTEADEAAANMRADLSRILTFDHAVAHLATIGVTDETQGMQVRDNMAEALLNRANAFRRRCDKIVADDVHSCMSDVVSTLAVGGHGMVTFNGLEPRNPRLSPIAPIMALCDQASELCAPLPDHESAAIEAGWSKSSSGIWERNADDENDEDESQAASNAQAACEHDGIEPHDREVYEHWAVSQWLADKLEGKGERIDRDFAGLIVWARTTTGQAISIDAVIVEIVADLEREG